MGEVLAVVGKDFVEPGSFDSRADLEYELAKDRGEAEGVKVLAPRVVQAKPDLFEGAEQGRPSDPARMVRGAA